jgi:hypothetical protein
VTIFTHVTRFRPGVALAAAALLAALALQCVLSLRTMSPTFDEHAHLPAGYSYWATLDLRLNPQHPPLVKLLCAAPLLLLHPRVDWSDSAWASANEWRFGHVFFYESGNDVDRLLFWARLPIVALSLVLGLYVFRWSRERFGPRAGLAALLLYAFCPTVIAHSRLVTMDLALAAFSTACLYHLWRYRGSGRRADLVACAVALGLALATKFSALVLAPIVPALLLHRRPRDWRAPVVALGIAALVVWGAYLFASPSAYVRGLTLVNQDHPVDHPYYLLGAFKPGGWRSYFALAFLMKTPIPVLLALAGGAVAAWRTRAATLGDDVVLLVPAAAFFLATSALADNLGVRYLLPVYPLLFVFASRIGERAAGRGTAALVLAGLAAWQVVGTLRVYPDYIGYFNEAAGGPALGYRRLDDSNIDWGQDLKRLKTLVDAKGVGAFRLCYPMKGYPPYYGLQAEPFLPEEMVADPPPGDYAVSVQCLARVREHNAAAGRELDWLARFQPVGHVGAFYVFRF